LQLAILTTPMPTQHRFMIEQNRRIVGMLTKKRAKEALTGCKYLELLTLFSVSLPGYRQKMANPTNLARKELDGTENVLMALAHDVG
jgi:hypothetical protein